MIKLTQSVAAWRSPSFAATLVKEIQALGPGHPELQPLLQACLAHTSAVADEPLGVYLLSSHEQDGRILARLGVFYAGIVAGCSCADDPSPVDSMTEHCEVLLEIDAATGDTHLARGDI